MSDRHFGEHITIDGYGGNYGKLNDQHLIFEILNELPQKLDMSKLSEPVLYKAGNNGKKDPGGWTGMVIIKESHISIHTFPARGFVSADVYTCQNGLDKNFIIKYFKEYFDLKDVEENFIERGKKYPDNNIYTA